MFDLSIKSNNTFSTQKYPPELPKEPGIISSNTVNKQINTMDYNEVSTQNGQYKNSLTNEKHNVIN